MRRRHRACWVGILLALVAELGCEPRSAGPTPREPEELTTAGSTAAAPRPRATSNTAQAAASAAPPKPVGAGPVAEDSSNRAAALVAAATRIERVEVLDVGTRRLRATLTPQQVEQVRRSVAHATGRDSLTASSPPWDVVVRLHVPGRPPFLVHVVGGQALRLNAAEPYAARAHDATGRRLSDVEELAVDSTMYDLLALLLGPPAKEYRTPQAIDIGQLTRPVPDAAAP